MIECIQNYEHPLNDAWDHYIASNDLPGHALSGWHKVLEDIYNRKVLRLANIENDEIKAISLAYLDERGGYLYTTRFGLHSDGDESAKALMNWLDEYAQNHNLKQGLLTSGSQKIEDDHNWRQKGNMLLPLDFSSNDELWSSVPKKTRNMVRKAEKSDLEFAEGWENINGFYDVYEQRFTEKMLAIKPQNYFQSLPEIFGERIKLVCLKHKNKVVAGMIFLQTGKAVTYLYNASEDEALRNGGNNLLMWKAMEIYKDNGAKFIELGESTKDGAVYNFKKRLSKDIREIDIHYLDLNYKPIHKSKIQIAYEVFLRKTVQYFPAFLKVKYLHSLDQKGRVL